MTNKVIIIYGSSAGRNTLADPRAYFWTVLILSCLNVHVYNSLIRLWNYTMMTNGLIDWFIDSFVTEKWSTLSFNFSVLFITQFNERWQDWTYRIVSYRYWKRRLDASMSTSLWHRPTSIQYTNQFWLALLFPVPAISHLKLYMYTS